MRGRPPRVYAIADAATLGERRLAEAVDEMARAGVRWIQLRIKGLSDTAIHERVAECHRAVSGGDVELWMNDRADLAALFPFYGVHVGQSDLAPGEARACVGEKVRIGRSTHDAEQIREADLDPDVDVVAYGPVFATASKPDHERVVGLEGLKAARRLTTKPLVAIGGITLESVRPVLDTGVDSVAMIGGICRGDIGLNCRRLLEAASQGARA